MWALLLLLLARTARASIEAKYYYSVPDNACTSTDGAASFIFERYGPWRQPLRPVQVDVARKTITAYYPEPLAGSYEVEGVRYDNSRCSFCPYGGPQEAPQPEILMSGGIRYPPLPMAGPCFDSLRSLPTSCVQHELLYPSAFVGEYYYPPQTLNEYVNQFPWYHHSLVEGGETGSHTNLDSAGHPRRPTDYGLGKARVLAHLATFRVINTTTQQTDTALTDMLQAPYSSTATGTQHWPKWAQHHCRPACHRDALMQQYEIRPSDYAGKPAFTYLARRSTTTGVQGVSEPLRVQRCVACPPYQAAYEWGTYDADQVYDADMPEDPRQIYISGDCHPWFGSVPRLTMLPPYELGGVTLVNHSVSQDGVLDPAYNLVYEGVPCPVDTYNDRCAHYHLYTARETPGVLVQPQCAPCPPGGYHTGGKTGAWFCLPPPGKTALRVAGESPLQSMLNLFVGRADNVSTLWARRDALGYEWECGTKPEHCHQCRSVPGMAGKWPHQFNQEMILKHLLVWQDCPSGFYCPTALEAPPVACPPAFPWSPPGSHSVQNCTCRRGTFRPSGGGDCSACLQPIVCPTGQYLAGTLRCTLFDGATSGGTCTPCTNAPPNATYAGGAGIEVVVVYAGGNPDYRGACAFKCPLGTVLLGDDFCLPPTGFQCSLAPAARLGGGDKALVYNSRLSSSIEGFRVSECNTGRCCTDRPLMMALRGLDTMSQPTGDWLQVSPTCTQATPVVCGPLGAICAVVTGATYARDIVCAACPQPPPNGFYESVVMRGTPPAAECLVRCTSNFYFNSSDRQCGSCIELDHRLCSTNGTNAGAGWEEGRRVSGGGCYGDYAPFATPTDLRTIRCVKCVATPPLVGSGWYLDTANPDGCVSRPCSAIPRVDSGQEYVVTHCGGTSNFVTAACVTGCPDGHYLKGSCSRSATGVCTPCTMLRRGYHRIGPCGDASDSVWQACGVPADGGAFVPGFYCPVDEPDAMRRCPNNMTSIARAWDVGGHCFCPAGTRPRRMADGDDASAQRVCEPMRCADALPYAAAPGGGWRSASYLTIDVSNLTSVCQPCSPPPLQLLPNGYSAAFTLGDGLEQGACRCAPGSYLISVQQQQLACAPCPLLLPGTISACAQNGGFSTTVPDTCWSGLQAGAPTCQPVLPPFTTAAGVGTLLTCAAGFLRAQTPLLVPDTPREPSTGSPLHIARARSTAGWARLPLLSSTGGGGGGGASFADYNVSHLAVTSDYADWGFSDNMQYALWLIADPGSTNVYAAPLPRPNTEAFFAYDPYTSVGMWTIVPASDTGSLYTVEGLAVAQWPIPQSPARVSDNVIRLSAYTDAAAVVVDHTLGYLWLYTNTLSVGGDGLVAWGTAPSFRIDVAPHRLTLLKEPEPLEPVATAHAYVLPAAPDNTAFNPNNGGHVTALRASSTFFVAYNRPAPYPPEIAAIRVRSGSDGSVRRAFVSGAVLPISAMAVLPLPEGGGVYLYLALRAPSSSPVRRIQWAMPPAGGGGSMQQLPEGVDELFFLPQQPPPGVVRSLSLLWPTTALAPIFVALVADAATDVASAQPILHARGGPPSSVYAADYVQRTFVPLQGMPSPTRPTALALTGTNLNTALLVASDDTSGAVFTLPAGRCSTDPDLRYWDGASCIAHACVRARQCATGQGGQVWNARLLRCACAAGFFVGAGSTDAALVCQACPAGRVCSGNGTSVPCPFFPATSPVGATSESDCLCPVGYYFKAGTPAACAPCPPGFWCPNQWDARACPGRADALQQGAGGGGGGNYFPAACVCAEGSVGALCAACPADSFCPGGTTEVVNSAVRVSLAPVDALATTLEEADVCAALVTLLATYFQIGSLWYLKDPATLARRVYCAFVPAPATRTAIGPMAYLMVQTEPADKGSVLGMPSALSLQRNATAAEGRFVLTDVSPAPGKNPIQVNVRNNTAVLCGAGKTPSAGLIGCVCAPGYESVELKCKACAAGLYKPASGAGNCLVCPLGTTSAAGAPVCSGGTGPGTNGNNNNSSGGAGGGGGGQDSPLNIPLIAGGVAGGVIASCCLLYAIVAFA
jgi:hypothetical protein